MPYIWRVQNKSGEGPYQNAYKSGNQIRKSLCEAHNDYNDIEDDGSYKHPSINSDCIDGIETYMRCGFKTKKDGLKWFEGWINSLESIGYYLVRIKCNTIYETYSGKQIAFD